MHCAVQTLFRPCSDLFWVQTQSSAARLPLFHQCLSSKTHGHEKLHTIPTYIRAKRPILFKWGPNYGHVGLIRQSHPTRLLRAIVSGDALTAPEGHAQDHGFGHGRYTSDNTLRTRCSARDDYDSLPRSRRILAAWVLGVLQLPLLLQHGLRSQHVLPAFWMDVRDPFYVCYDCYDATTAVVKL